MCDEVLELVDLGYKRDALVTSLSRGMTQRLGLARVLLHDPQVLLLGRAGQRPRSRGPASRSAGCSRSCASMGKTIMVSSHILPELADICNKIGIIERGELMVNADGRRRDEAGPAADGAATSAWPATATAAAKLLEQHPIVERVEVRRQASHRHARRRPARLQRPGHRCWSTPATSSRCFKEDEINLETAFMALTKGITA